MMGSYWFNFPVGISPFAVQGLAHPDGEIATAKGRIAYSSMEIMTQILLYSKFIIWNFWDSEIRPRDR